MTFTPTHEQLDIVEQAKTGESFKTSAFAGAAKTSTLVLVSEAVKHPSLYLAYNKRMAEEARSKFPSWVDVRTTHSLAYREEGVKIAHKLSRPVGGYVNVCGTPAEIGRFYKLKDIKLSEDKWITSALLGMLVKLTVNNFEYSPDKTLSAKHIVYDSAYKFIEERLIKQERIDKIVLPLAQKLWAERSNPDSNILATHDTYLKMFQLSCPDLSAYKTIYLDEAQDSNDCVLDIVLSQKDSQLVLVGDSFQAIYQWRGSVNALKKIKTAQKNLSTSFRFGSNIASVANVLLTVSEDVHMEGWDKVNTTISVEKPKGMDSFTKIFRTNAALIEEATDYILEGIPIRVEVDFNDLVKAIESGLALYKGELKGVKHDLFIGCKTWDDAVLESKYSGDIKRICKMITEGTYFRILRAIREYSPQRDAKILFISAHKSKGLEWDNVVIGGDFPPVYNEEGEYAWSEGERNLSYVAHTRAKKHLVVGDSLMQILSYGEADPEEVTKVKKALGLIK